MAPQTLFKELLARDILIRDVSRYPMLSDYFRVSVGSPEENDRFIEALKRFRYAQLLGSDIDVVDTCTQGSTNNVLSSVDERARAVNDRPSSMKCFVKGLCIVNGCFTTFHV